MKILVFAGGGGTRLWPVSREAAPKQFQKLVGAKTLFSLTMERLLSRYKLNDIYIIVPGTYVDHVKKLLPDIQEDHIIIEPHKWDTFASIGYASFSLFQKFPRENFFYVWSDHVIKDEKALFDAIDVANIYARRKNKIVRIGAKATYPEVNWGYLQFSDEVAKINGIPIYGLEHHYEKPSLAEAKKFVGSFSYLWNTGYIVAPSGKIIDAYKKYAPDASKILVTITKKTFKGDIIQQYKKINKTSIDYEILEKADSKEFAVIPIDAGWIDVGDWKSLKTELEKNNQDIVRIGSAKNVITMDSSDAIVYSDNAKKMICLIGVADIAVIETKDVLLICNKEQSRDVKKLFEKIAKQDHKLT